MNQIERRSEKIGLSPEEIDEVKSIVIKGRPISKAIDDVLKIPESSDLETQIVEIENDMDSIRRRKT